MGKGLLFGTLIAASFACGALSADASACGLFFGPRTTERRPSLAAEQALIVYDGARHREHFIREITFRGSPERFGFVVPTPSLPEVGKIDKSPFKILHAKLPYDTPPEEPGFGHGFGLGGIGNGSGRSSGVTVIEVKKVGSFTAFVLAANDAAALAKWLSDNELTKSPESTPWLEHYVHSGFHFVAMRYDPPKPAASQRAGEATASSDGTVKAEVVRISFDTPRAYYPYFEPNRSSRATGPRMLEIWLATQAGPSQPLALHATSAGARWLRPFAEGQRFGAESRAALTEAMAADARLLPAGQLVVQRFLDQKQRRDGWGDVVFVPEKRDPLDRVTDDALTKLAAVLDPRLLPEAK